jgi:hypothetical protein
MTRSTPATGKNAQPIRLPMSTKPMPGDDRGCGVEAKHDALLMFEVRYPVAHRAIDDDLQVL